MKTLLLLFAAACFCLVPVVSLAGNAHPTLYLEIYTLDQNPDDPGPAPAYLCVHSSPGPVELPCYGPKVPYSFAVIPLHIGKIDSPLAEGWPLACGPGGGYAAATFGVSRSGASCSFVGFTACPGFLIGPSYAGFPAACLVAATSKCHDWMDHPGYLTYFTSTDVGASYFDIVSNADEGYARVVNCQAEFDLGTLIGGGAQWGGSQSIICAMDPSTDPTAVDFTTWGSIKCLYR